MPPPLPPVQMTPNSQGDFPQLRYQPNVRTNSDYGVGQPVATPHMNMPMPDSNPQHLRTPVSSDQQPLANAQMHPPNTLEDQLRHMIIRNDSTPGRQQAACGPSSLDLSRQASATSQQRSFRRPNQMQRKQQAQQMQMSLQYTSMPTGVADMRNVGQLQHREVRTSAELPGVRHRPVTGPPQHGINQRRPPESISQPRSLFDPNAGPGGGRGGIYNQKQHMADDQVQISYIDRLASAKVREVQISPEELSEKQLLKQRLNEICRDVILKHEVKLNPDFPDHSIELKSFGSLSIGFATKESDMDLVLVSPDSKPALSSPESPLPRMVEKALMDLGYGARLLTQTRVPIIKFCEKPGHELAAHLRLVRLHWQRDNKAHDEQARSKATDEISGISAGKPEILQSAKTSDLIPPTLDAHTSEDSSTTVSVTPLKADKISLREKIEIDPAWLPLLSDYELIGLFKVAVKEDRCEPHQKAMVTACLERIEDQSLSRDSSILQESREALWNMADVIKKCRVPGRGDLEFPKSGVGTQCDINFSNQLALHNSLLLKCYSLCDPRVRQMVLFVKAWTKRRKINSPYHGTLNSYGYVLMVLHFLMNVAQPPLIPNLQLAKDLIRNDPLSSREVSSDGHNIQFFRNETALQEMAQNGVFGQNKESLGSLLRSFFRFYANPPFGTFSWKEDVLSLRTKGGVLTKVGKGWVGARTEMVDLAGPGPGQKKVNHHYVVAIEDPFETGHNVARTVFFNGVVAIRDEFRRAADLISNGGVDPRTGPQDFFAEGKKNENLQHRHGPSRREVGQNKSSGPVESDKSEKGLALKNKGPNQKAGTGTNEPAAQTAPETGKLVAMVENPLSEARKMSVPPATMTNSSLDSV